MINKKFIFTFIFVSIFIYSFISIIISFSIAEEEEKTFIGMSGCLECHESTTRKIVENYKKSIHYSVLSNSKDPSKQGCEACHGPGSKHKETTLDIINPNKLDPQDSSKICLTCHSNVNRKSNWHFSKHNQTGKGCLGCHSAHSSKKRLLKQEAKEDNISRLCLSCHNDQAHKFKLTSHHPLFEERIKCTDCHNQHGSDNPNSLIKETNDLCLTCHPNYKGPFAVEHPATDANYQKGCLNCHDAHGSPNRHLLTLTDRGTCLQCHGDKIVEHNQGSNCLSCHSYIHGSSSLSSIPFGNP